MDKYSNRFMLVEMLHSVHTLLGESGLDQLIAQREQQSLVRYQQAMAGTTHYEDRLCTLTEQRCLEGYMAEWSPQIDGARRCAYRIRPITD